ncbi:MAG TPA: cytochrome c [Burkholderiales bacterium]|nr:cytochrome c [Burkholderiales bacterium]
MSNRNAPRARGMLSWAGVAALLAAVPVVLGAPPAREARMELGRKVFTEIAEPKCGICHTLKDAGATGEIGAKLEDIQPDEQRVLTAVRGGVGVMPRYDDKLTKEQIEAVAYYVSRAVRQPK